MISGKLWVDCRKFLNRQNQSVVTGMLTLFGQTVGKTAIDVKAEICDQLLETENKKLRDTLRNSMQSTKYTYSEWISYLNEENSGCDEFVLYLLYQTFKRHVVVILSSSLWSSFKPGTMSTFEKLNKADHVLAWLREDKYGEVRPLHIKAGVGNALEWQHLAEAIDHTNEKRMSAKQPKRPDKSTNIKPRKVPNTETVTSEPTRPPRGKRESSMNINYKHYHADGIRSAKSPRKDKTLPQKTGPSTSRLAAQQMISNQKAIKKEITQTNKKNVLVKPDPEIHMIYKKPKENVYWQYVHTDGRPCPKGATGVCRRKRSKNRTDDMELPDLPESSPPHVQATYHKSITETLDNIDPNTEAAIKTVLSGYIHQPRPRSVTTGEKNLETSPDNPNTLISPPAINRTNAMPCTPKPRQTKNLNDLLSTLDFDVIPMATERTPTSSEKHTRSVATDTVKSTNTELDVNPLATGSTPTSSKKHTRSVVTDTVEATNTEQTHTDPVATGSTPTSKENHTRSVVTDLVDLVESTITEQTNTKSITNENQRRSVITTTAQETSTEHRTDEPDTHTNATKDNNPDNETSRSVATIESVNVPKTISEGDPTNTNGSHFTTMSLKPPDKDNVQANEYSSDELPDLVLPYTRSVITSPPNQCTTQNNNGTEQTPKRNQTGSTSQPSTTPRSVLSDPDDTEIETVNTLLSLGSLESIDKTVDNEALLPVDRPRIDDFTKELAVQERMEHPTDDSDSDTTIAYEDKGTDAAPTAEPKSPKGVFRSKHYGIKRQSPTQSKI